MAQPTPPTKDSGCQPDEDCRGTTPPMSAHDPDGLGQSSITVRPPQMPFAWQHDRQLLLLDHTERGWTVAELCFEAELLRYVEVRRATYRWPREAAGVLLARGIRCGDASITRLARALDRWIENRLAGTISRAL